MSVKEVVAPADSPEHDSSAQMEHLEHAIEHATHLLPSQGPITVFIHHNTLHAFEDLPFHRGVQKGAELFGCQPYLDEDNYRRMLVRGQIKAEDLAAVVMEDSGEPAEQTIGPFGSRFHLRMAMLQYPIRTAPEAELRWFVAETDALSKFRDDAPALNKSRMIDETRHWVMRDLRKGNNGDDTSGDSRLDRAHKALADLIIHFGKSAIERWSDADWEAFTLQALWRACRSGVHGIKHPTPHEHRVARHRDVLFESTGADADLLVHDVLIRFCSAFLDQGFSQWVLPRRDEGFIASFCALYRELGGMPDRWLRGLSQELSHFEGRRITAMDSILESLAALGVPEDQWEPYLTATLLALRGWAGMIHQVEIRGDRAVHPIPPGSVREFLAIRLLLDRLALAHLAEETLGFDGPLDTLRDTAHKRIQKHDAASGVDQRAFFVYQLAQIRGWSPAELFQIRKEEWAQFIAEVERFPSLQRRQVFHEAFERRFRIQVLDTVALRARRGIPKSYPTRVQVVTCLDEREESFRRHLEELSPSVETFGLAGFFSIAMYYRGVADASFVPLAPIVVRPDHWVEETVIDPNEDSSRAQARRAIGLASHGAHLSSRSAFTGAVLSAAFGALASVPLVARVFFPRATSKMRQHADSLVQPPTATRLHLERTEAATKGEDGKGGYTVAEMADLAERSLRDVGLVSDFARLVVLLGHGSNSVNNPHKSAYDCGACGGNAGGPNARAAALILNDPRVRALLKERGLAIPPDTIFLGGFHNTCNDSVTFSDLEAVPASHHEDLKFFREILEHALDRNAHERCRRFQSAPLNLSFSAARRHVEERSADLAQTRPECGHATNAICIVGRRGRTKGLFLDRRAFLTSYDPKSDDADASILTRILMAAVPVCSGINLEYYFSYVDPTGWGCGTKLPHNVTSMLGIMDGAASDLRTGLPWQMVEIHQPVRLSFVIETQPETMLKIMAKHESIGRLCRNEWIHLATLDPDSPRVHLFRKGVFVPYSPEAVELPLVASSVDWYRGWRDHLGFALVQT